LIWKRRERRSRDVGSYRISFGGKHRECRDSDLCNQNSNEAGLEEILQDGTDINGSEIFFSFGDNLLYFEIHGFK
jgi:hypothetical protein